MQSIIDEIAAAEQQADEIRQQAAVQARETLSFAQSDAETMLSDTDIAERDKTREALVAAEREGGEAAQEILQGMKREADALCEKARERTADAVTYLVKRVTEAS